MRVLSVSISLLMVATLVGVILYMNNIMSNDPPNASSQDEDNQTDVTHTDVGPDENGELGDDIWRKKLTPMQYHVTREQGTERAFTGEYWDHKEDGIYKCVCCGQPLFDSKTKFKSGSGWPSFFDIIDVKSIQTEKDDKLFWETRTELICSGCDAHLGHVFADGPQPTGLRYCINSAALDFEKRAK